MMQSHVAATCNRPSKRFVQHNLVPLRGFPFAGYFQDELKYKQIIANTQLSLIREEIRQLHFIFGSEGKIPYQPLRPCFSIPLSAENRITHQIPHASTHF